jgi:HEPN domain-containing protein
MSGVEPDIDPGNRREARRWLAIVEEDLDVANAAARLPNPRRGAAAYHLQQAAEKIIKSLLVLTGEPFRRTHDLDDLATRLLQVYPQFAVTSEAVRRLTIWGVAYRYPGLEDEPDVPPGPEDLEQVTTLLAEFAAEAARLIGQG